MRLGRFSLPLFRVLAAVTCVAAVADAVRRLYFGVGVGDESLYVAIPYRFAIGDRPFLDELNITHDKSRADDANREVLPGGRWWNVIQHRSSQQPIALYARRMAANNTMESHMLDSCCVTTPGATGANCSIR